MFSYTPKFHHAVITTLLLVLCMLASSRVQGRAITAWNVGALSMAVITAVILALLIMEALNHRVEVMTDFAREIGKLDDEARAMLAFEFPSMRYRMKKGIVREYFEDTNVSIETFRLFLQTSNERYISPRRDWQTAERPEWAWIEIEQWLEARDYIIKDSAAGSHSWLWKGNSYRHLMAYWVGGRVQNLNREMEAV